MRAPYCLPPPTQVLPEGSYASDCKCDRRRNAMSVKT